MNKQIIGEGRYEVAEHQQFYDRTGQQVRVVRGSSQPVPIGKAYAFFNCSAPKEQIEAELPNIREAFGINQDLELRLEEDPNVFDKKLTPFYVTAVGRSKQRPKTETSQTSYFDYVLQADLPNGTNLEAATELQNIMNPIYNSTHLYKAKEPMFGEIVYKSEDSYATLD